MYSSTPSLASAVGWVVNATPWPSYPRERPHTHCVGGSVGPGTVLEECTKSHPSQDLIPGPSGPYKVTTPTALSRPSIFKNKMYEAEMLLRAWYCSMNNHCISSQRNL